MKLYGTLLLLQMLLFVLASDVHAQVPQPPAANNADNEDRTILTRNEFTGGLLIHSEGWGITLRRSKQQTYKKKKYIELDIVSMKDPKEVRSINSTYDNSKSYIYGKLNDFIVSRIGIGKQNILFAKAHAAGVEVRYHYGVGLSLGITKPIYLNIVEGPYSSGSGEYYNITVLRSNPYDLTNQSPENIFGNASFTYGLGQMSLHPGGYIKSGLSFEYAKYPDEVWSIETGAVLDVYPQDIPIMAFSPNHNVFLNFYISLSYGGKW